MKSHSYPTPLRALIACASLIFHPHVSAAAPSWADSGDGFRAGTLGNSGQNLYVNSRGELETIRHCDVDGNGRPDLVFCTGHDPYYFIPATVATVAGTDLQARDLAVDGSIAVVPSDLNRDGFTDLVFLPNRSNVQYGFRQSLRIAWGGPDGWSDTRVTRQLPVYGDFNAESRYLLPLDVRVAVGDMNSDGWPDILVLNGLHWLPDQPAGRILRIYWGSRGGFLFTNCQDIGIPGAVEIAAGGFGDRRQFPAAVLTDSGEIQYLERSSSRGLQPARAGRLPLKSAGAGPAVKPLCMIAQPSESENGDILWIGTDSKTLFRVGTSGAAPDIKAINAQPATRIAIGCLDDDPYPDVVLTDQQHLTITVPGAPPSTIAVLWGAADGVDETRSASLSIPFGVSTTVGDLDADGHGDLVVAVLQTDKEMKASSLVYLGDGTRHLSKSPVPVSTEGACDVAIVKASSDASPVAVFANGLSFTLNGMGTTRFYWGGQGGFSPTDLTEIPVLAGLKQSLSDLNADGYPDLIMIQGADIGKETSDYFASTVGADIFWGGPEGDIHGPGPVHFDSKRRQVLHETHLCAINVADLNKDGYLDIVLGSYEMDASSGTDLKIYYGSAKGYSDANRTLVHATSRGSDLLIADFDRDGYLDIATVGYDNHRVTTFRGGADGFKADRISELQYPDAISLEGADLNKDGWLDLVVSSYNDPATNTRDTGFSVFWGGPSGWRQSDSQWLEGHSPVGIAIADVDSDGFLDIVTPNYHGEVNRQDLASYIYWGSAHGFSIHDRTSLPVDSGHDVLIADFDGDGRLDLAFNAHSTNGGHRTSSPVYYNDGERFRNSPRVQHLPVTGPFYGWMQDLGNIYTRQFDEEFTSRTFSWNDTHRGGRLSVDAATPFGSSVKLKVRSAASAEALESAPWRDVAGDGFSLAKGDRILQYHLDLVSANGDSYPTVRKVGVQLK